MSIRTANPKERGMTDEQLRLRRKADQAWDLAGLSRQDNDQADAERYTAQAREYERLLRETY